MISDVPLRAFLSGGYDLSLITAIAQEHSKELVKTVFIGFHAEKYNKARQAYKVAKHLGTQHTELYISKKEMFDMVEMVSAICQSLNNLQQRQTVIIQDQQGHFMHSGSDIRTICKGAKDMKQKG